jgi:hypothetical protein
MKKSPLVLFLFMYLCSFAQDGISYESILHKAADRYKNGLLDSADVKITFFKDDFKKLLDPFKKCYIYPDTIRYIDGFTAVGHSIIIPDPHLSSMELQIGYWTYYYPSGSIYSRGKFEIGALTECYADGASVSSYNFKVGQWQYWYENGQALTTGNYTPRKVVWKNSCGSDTVLQSMISRQWMFYDSDGKEKRDIEDSVVEKVNTRHEGTFYRDVLKSRAIREKVIE